MSKKAHIIINPFSAGGKTSRKIGLLLDAVRFRYGSQYSVFVTDSPLSATRSAKEAIGHGIEFLVAVGGDGTVQETVNGFFSNGSLTNPECELGILPSGTGNGFAQSLGLCQPFDKQVERLFSGSARRLDIGKVWFRSGTNGTQLRYFVNECQLGIGGEVVKKVQKTLKRMGGTAAFALGTLPTIFTYKNQSLTVTLDDQSIYVCPMTGVVVANGAFTGGGMNLAPGASMVDGLLDVLIMVDLSVPQRLLSFPRVYSGNHATLPGFRISKAKKIRIESREFVDVEADGESLGAAPCTVEIVPAILPVRCMPERKEKPHETNV